MHYWHLYKKAMSSKGQCSSASFAFRRKLCWVSRALPCPPSLLHRVHWLFGWPWNSPDKTDAIFFSGLKWTGWGCTVKDSRRGRGPANVRLCFACVLKQTETGQFHHLPGASSRGMKPKIGLSSRFQIQKEVGSSEVELESKIKMWSLLRINLVKRNFFPRKYST